MHLDEGTASLDLRLMLVPTSGRLSEVRDTVNPASSKRQSLTCKLSKNGEETCLRLYRPTQLIYMVMRESVNRTFNEQTGFCPVCKQSEKTSFGSFERIR